MDNGRTTKYFKFHWLCWRLLGINSIGVQHKIPYAVYAVVFNVAVTIFMPLHFFLTIFLMDQTSAEFHKNLTTCCTALTGSLKTLIFYTKLKKIQEIEKILNNLERRLESNEEDLQYYSALQQKVRLISNLFKGVYMGAGSAAVAAWLFSGERSLVHPGVWVPFNWEESQFQYCLSCALQLYGTVGQVWQVFAADCFPPLALLYLSGHIELLARRIARVGWQVHEKNPELQCLLDEQKLQKCIEDQLSLYELFDVIQNIISPPMFVQFAVTAAIICNALVVVLFYAETNFEYFFFFMYILGTPFQLVPCCYYGTKMERLFHDLSYAVFRCNWTHQGRNFKRHMLLFTERSLRPTKASALQLFDINLETLLATYKGGYSLLALILEMKN